MRQIFMVNVTDNLSVSAGGSLRAATALGVTGPRSLPEQEGQRLHEACPAEHPHKSGPPKFLPRRHAGEPGMDGLELGFDDGEVGARLIGPAQGKAGRGVIGRTPFVPEDG